MKVKGLKKFGAAVDYFTGFNPLNLNLAFPFYRHALAQPGYAALRVGGQDFTYGDLARRAQAVAGWIDEQSQHSPCRVILLGAGSWESYASLLGACWSGSAYVPLSAKLPVARLKHLIETIEPAAILLDAEGAAAIQNMAEPITCPQLRVQEMPPAAQINPPAHVDGTSLAYILFTSGSTGVPKGVMIHFAAVSRFLATMADRYPLTPSDRVAQPCELGFDISVSNIFCAWNAGATVVHVPPTQVMIPRDFLRQEAITMWFSTPSAAVFMEQMKMLKPGVFPKLRYTLFGGDGLPAETAGKWTEAAPNGRLDNVYGPTETAVVVTAVEYTGQSLTTPGRGIVSIGAPFPEADLMVMDVTGQPVADGETGELWIGGPQVGLGYWKNAELTQSHFPTIDGQKWYRSGDLVFRDAGGLFHFHGRVDNQVKVRGFRVELGEVEAHLREVCFTNSVAALAWPLKQGSAGGLVAFVSGTQLSPTQIRTALLGCIPKYLVPDQIRVLDSMPVGATGKFDRKALAQMLENGL